MAKATEIFSSGFFFNDTATTEIYTLSLHDALPIFGLRPGDEPRGGRRVRRGDAGQRSEEHTSELQSQSNLVCRLLLEKKKKNFRFKAPLVYTIVKYYHAFYRMFDSLNAIVTLCPFTWQDRLLMLFFFFFNDTATTEIYTLSLHDALPISGCSIPQGELILSRTQPRTVVR